MNQNGVREELQRAAREAERRGRLPSGADVRARGDRRRARANAVRGVAALLVVAGATGGWFLTQDGTDPSPPPATRTTEPAPTESTTSVPAREFRTPDGLLLATTAEGGVSLEAPGSLDGPSMGRWFADPLETPGRYVLRNEARTDGIDQCLQVPVEGSVAIGSCEPGEAIQVFDLVGTGNSSCTLGSSLGALVVEADGSLTTSTDPAAATRFTVADPDDPGSAADL